MANAVQKLATVHELMGDWILQNPGRTYREMAAHFGYSVSWLCQVVNSDMFKAYMGERLKDVHAHVTQDVPTLLKGVAIQSIERISEVLQKTEDAEVILDAFDKVMHTYGYAQGAKPGALSGTAIQQNNFYLSKQDFLQAQQALLGAHQPPAPAAPEQVVSGELVPAT